MSKCHRAIVLVATLLAVAGVSAAPPDVPLIEAVKAGDREAASRLLNAGEDPNAGLPDGTTALHWAAYRDDIDAVELLVAAGAAVGAANRYGATPLSLAADAGYGAVVERLLAAGADANTALPGGETTLMTAARTGNLQSVAALVAAGADVNAAEETRGQTALMWAAGEGHAGVIRVLLEAGADLHARSHGPESAEAAAGSGTYTRRVRRMDEFTPFLFAVRAGRTEAVQALLDGGADVNETAPDGTSALVIAAANAHWELAAFLLEKGADPNAAEQGWPALHQVIRTRNLNIGFFPHPEPTGTVSSLEFAALLIEHGADVNARIVEPIVDGFRGFWTQKGATPILVAAKGADAAMMRLLADHGADSSLANERGTTPIMAASGVEMFNPNEDSGTNPEALEALEVALELGGDVNAPNNDGDTPLHGAAWRGANDIILRLVEEGAELHVENQRGYTPLQIANGEEEGRVANINIRPWTVALLQELLRERGLPWELQRGQERFAFESKEIDTRSDEEITREFLEQLGLSPEDIEAALAAQQGGGR
ncbi:MAG: ankyrin repeat domain-containing protein [Acidobacteria bacterium]|nr:ankyrin repeat domain-containing protein [Acidobacteriota bacterium]